MICVSPTLANHAEADTRANRADEQPALRPTKQPPNRSSDYFSVVPAKQPPFWPAQQQTLRLAEQPPIISTNAQRRGGDLHQLHHQAPG